MNPASLLYGALILSLCIFSGAEGADWVKIGESDKTVVYIDKPPKEKVKALVKVEEKSEATSVDYIISHDEYDCTQRKVRNLSLTFYYRSGKTGSFEPKEQAWDRITPQTYRDVAFNYVCSQ
jgi:hypothetical protein